ncbi:MAG: ABC transporter ATP-binding protein [Deltaproteobacteria bacterium]|nr:ABC transporter ATP-binding protein [Deltaproteobacteria bacterium]
MTAPVIAIRDLRRRFRDVEALAGVDLQVAGPGVFGFLGVNGAGKTTTLRILAGLIHATGGEVRLFGEPVAIGQAEVRRRIGYLPQDPVFFPWLTGEETLLLVADLFGLPGAIARRRAGEWLERLGLGHAARRRVGGYSGGMLQRLGLAQALINEPELLLLDEPVSALDPVGRVEILTLLGALSSRATVFMSSHILADVERVCGEVAIIDHGRIVVRDRTDALRERFLKPEFELALAGAAAPLIALASGAPWIEQLRVIEQGEFGATLRIAVTDAALGRRELPRLIAHSQVELLRFDAAVPTLEEVFIRIVGSRGAAAEGA